MLEHERSQLRALKLKQLERLERNLLRLRLQFCRFLTRPTASGACNNRASKIHVEPSSPPEEEKHLTPGAFGKLSSIVSTTAPAVKYAVKYWSGQIMARANNCDTAQELNGSVTVSTVSGLAGFFGAFNLDLDGDFVANH